jgi:hypothetical protein
MKLPKVTSNDPVERITIPFKQSTRTQLAAYQEHYQRTYGEEITQNHLIESMLVEYMKEDKAFQKAIDRQAKSGKPASGSGD